MYPNRTPVLLIVVLMLLAGCVGGADIAPTADIDDTSTPTDGGGSADTGVPSDGDDFKLSNPERLLRNTGSFTASWSYTGVEITVTREFAADLDAERSYSRTTSTTDGQSDAGGVKQYVTDGVTYVRVGDDDEATYTSYEGSAEVLVAAIVLSQAHAYGADDDLTFAGAETFNGASVERYELPAVNEALILAGSAAAQDEPGTLEVTSFEYIVLVDGGGLSRHESWSFSGRMDGGFKVSGSWEYSLTGVGSTTVKEPAWPDEARA